jgi:hypothetical protein
MSDKAQKNLAELSDEEFLDEFAGMQAELASSANEASDPGVQEEAQSTDSDADTEQSAEETGGADSEEPAEEVSADGVDSASEQVDEEDGNEEPSVDTAGERADPHQGEATDDSKSTDASESPEVPDAQAELAKVLAPLKAAKRTINLESVDQARQLMQMGVDYSRKMEQMKPYQRVLKTLERADLVDESKINFLIDLANKQPEAIKKLLKDSDIDPLDLDLEDSNDYRPNDHLIPESEMAIEEVLDTVRESPAFNKTVDVITGWDTASKRLLMDNPQVIRHLNDHMEAGIYDMIMDRLASDRIFGKHSGLSDLEAYKAVGDALHAEGAFNAPNPQATSTAGNTNQGHSQDSQGSNDSSLKNRKRAASPPKGTASSVKGKKQPDFSKMTDEEIENYDWRSQLT